MRIHLSLDHETQRINNTIQLHETIRRACLFVAKEGAL